MSEVDEEEGKVEEIVREEVVFLAGSSGCSGASMIIVTCLVGFLLLLPTNDKEEVE